MAKKPQKLLSVEGVAVPVASDATDMTEVVDGVEVTEVMEVVDVVETSQPTARNPRNPRKPKPEPTVIDKSLFAMQRLELVLEFIEPILGTVPSDRNTWDTFIRPRAADNMVDAMEKTEDEVTVHPSYRDKSAVNKRASEDLKAAKTTPEDDAESDAPLTRPMTAFFSDEEGPLLMDYQVMGHLKEMGNIVKDVVKVTALRSKIAKWCYVRPRRIHFTLASPVKELTRPLRAETAQGPRVTLATSEVIGTCSQIRFSVYFIPNGEVTPKLIATMLDAYGSFRGMGQWRGGGWGTYRVVSAEVMHD